MNPLLYFIQPISNFLAEALVNGLVFSAILFCWAFSFMLLQKRSLDLPRSKHGRLFSPAV